LFLVVPSFVGKAFADDESVFKVSVLQPMDASYDVVYKALEEERFYVVFEPDIGANLSRMAKRWGEDYNRNELTGIRSMVFCNAWYANKVSNLDPDMLGFCPLHITLVERMQGSHAQTTVLFNRPTAMTAGSAAHELLGRIEAEVIDAIEKGLDMLERGQAGKPTGAP
jgi:hypothetical protein